MPRTAAVAYVSTDKATRGVTAAWQPLAHKWHKRTAIDGLRLAVRLLLAALRKGPLVHEGPYRCLGVQEVQHLDITHRHPTHGAGVTRLGRLEGRATHATTASVEHTARMVGTLAAKPHVRKPVCHAGATSQPRNQHGAHRAAALGVPSVCARTENRLTLRYTFQATKTKRTQMPHTCSASSTSPILTRLDTGVDNVSE